MTQQLDIEVACNEIHLPSKTEEIIATTKDIIDYRISTAILPNDTEYIENQESYKDYIDTYINNDMTPFIPMGFLSEGIFFLACKKGLNSNIKISDAAQDQTGIDFILSTRSKDFTLNLTTHPHKYYRHLKRLHATPLLLPNDKDFFMKMLLNEKYTYEDYLYEVCSLNQSVLRNEHDGYRIIVKNGQKNWYIRNRNGRKKYKGFPQKKDRKPIVISSRKEQELLTIISILNNLQYI